MPAGGRRLVTVDTSVAVPLLLRNHEEHSTVNQWRAGRTISLCGQAWIETYAVLTRLPGASRVAPADAARVMASNFSAPIWPRPDNRAEAVDLFAAASIAGGATYDAWVALAALDNRALLASRDARAEIIYRRLGVELEMIA
jgi:toxin FitB